MNIDVLHLLPSLSLFGGTPRKIRDLIQHSPRPHGIYCWARLEGAELAASFDAAFKADQIAVFQGTFGRNLLLHARELSRIIIKHNVKIVHGYFETGLLLAATVKYLRRETKTVVSFVGFPASVGRAKKILTSLMVSRIDRFIYVSQFTRKSFQLAYPKLLSRPGHIIYNGVIDRANKDPVEVVRDRFQIATVSGLVGWKNVGVLLDAISILSRTTRDIRLVVVGDGPLRKELEQRARTLGISGSVDFVGYREDIYSVLAGSGIYVHPALMEGFGIAVVEAMLLNLPVILADAGALPELVENEVSGLLVDPHAPQAWANAIQRLLEDGDLARRLAEAGRKRAEECFSVARFSGEHEQIYRELLNDS